MHRALSLLSRLHTSAPAAARAFASSSSAASQSGDAQPDGADKDSLVSLRRAKRDCHLQTLSAASAGLLRVALFHPCSRPWQSDRPHHGADGGSPRQSSFPEVQVKLKGCCLFLPHVARSLEKSRPKVAKELIEASSDAVADARQLKSQTSAIIKQHCSFVNKVLPPCSMPPRSESDGSQLASAKKAKDPNAPKRALSGCAQFISPFHSPLPPLSLFLLQRVTRAQVHAVCEERLG